MFIDPWEEHTPGGLIIGRSILRGSTSQEYALPGSWTPWESILLAR